MVRALLLAESRVWLADYRLARNDSQKLLMLQGEALKIGAALHRNSGEVTEMEKEMLAELVAVDVADLPWAWGRLEVASSLEERANQLEKGAAEGVRRYRAMALTVRESSDSVWEILQEVGISGL